MVVHIYGVLSRSRLRAQRFVSIFSIMFFYTKYEGTVCLTSIGSRAVVAGCVVDSVTSFVDGRRSFCLSEDISKSRRG